MAFLLSQGYWDDAGSTKSSLKFERNDADGQQAHPYLEAFDDEHVYLALSGFPFEASSSAELSGAGPGGGAIRLPRAWAKRVGLVDE